MTDVRQALQAIAAKAADGDIVFPTHAAIALRVQRLLDDPRCAIDQLVKLVSMEPVLSSRIIAIANSAAYNPGGRPVTEIRNAIARVGFSTLRAVAASVIVRQMTAVLSSPEQQSAAARLWEHTARVATLARVIAQRISRQNPDAAFFAGIVHEVGDFYLISCAGDYPGLLESDLEAWHEDKAAVGRAVLDALDVPDNIVEAIETLWAGFLAMPPTTLGDTLLLADELSTAESPIDTRSGMGRKGLPVELEMLIDGVMLSELLAESADELASLCSALDA